MCYLKAKLHKKVSLIKTKIGRHTAQPRMVAAFRPWPGYKGAGCALFLILKVFTFKKGMQRYYHFVSKSKFYFVFH